MEQADRTEVRQMLTDILAGPLEKIDGKLKLLVRQSSSIKEQIMKTNGRVMESEKKIIDLEKANINHINVCPAMPEIQGLKDDLAEYKWFKKNPKTGIAIIAVATILISYAFLGRFYEGRVASELKTYNEQKVKEFQRILTTIDSLKKK